MNIEIEDDSLREGLQAISSRQLSPKQAEKMILAADRCGVGHFILGFPSASTSEYQRVLSLLGFLESEKLQIKPWLLSRINTEDASLCLKVREQFPKASIGIAAFRGVSEVRWKVEGWTEKLFAEDLKRFCEMVHPSGFDISLNLEDITRASGSRIDFLLNLIGAHEFSSVALCDTLGVARPIDVQTLVGKFRSELGGNYPLLWHGHNDLGLALANTLQAIESGVNIVSGTFTGVGERSGNLPLEQIMLHLNLFSGHNFDLHEVRRYCEFLIDAFGIQMTPWTPVIGEHSFATQAGTHAAALLKAKELNYGEDKKVFLPYEPELLGRVETIEIGPNSGKKQIASILERNQIEFDDLLLSKLAERVKNEKRVTTEAKLINWLEDLRNSHERI